MLRLTKTSEQVLHMIRRITNRHRGMKENDTIRLVQAFVLSRVTYAAPYMVLSKRDTDKLNVIIRKATKQALGLPVSTSTDKLLSMGMHNTVAELIEGHLSNQKARLAQTSTGQKVLQQIKWTSQDAVPPKEIPQEWRRHIKIHPLPKNMHPDYHQGRREARAKALSKKYGPLGMVAYTDAASYHGRRAKTVVVTTKTDLLIGATLPQATTQEAEEIAVALALAQTKATIIITDCQQVCRNFTSGWVAQTTHRILATTKPDRNVEIVWAPAHSSLEGNEFAHRKARDFVDQATEETTELIPLTTYRDITQHYRLTRRTLPLPHPQLTKTQESTIRQLQSNTFPHPMRMHLLFSNQFEAQCKYCAQPGTLKHIVLECEQNPSLPPIHPPPHPPEQWETLLSSSHLADQLMLVERAVAAKTAHGYP